jgi:hypothetical protein
MACAGQDAAANRLDGLTEPVKANGHDLSNP